MLSAQLRSQLSWICTYLLYRRQSNWMSRELEVIFRELGITQYLDTFVEQGFDTWDTILDIQESDLDALGVKLGHRRKLQRRIANARGIAPSVSLASPPKPTAEEAKPNDARKESASGGDGAENTTLTKRKYRRHPKPDENAPERPPSAYVIFSNNLREGLKGQTLTFTEIAKLVGENWQSLPPSEKEKYESQANASKEKYHREMAQYKKTSEYRKYMKYLQEFKEKQGKAGQGQETAKRTKIERIQAVQGRTTTSSSPAGSGAALGIAPSIASGSSSESRELPSSRGHDSVDSVASEPRSRRSSTPKSTESVPSSQPAHLDVIDTPTGDHQRHSRQASSLRGRVRRGDASPRNLPSLSDVLTEGPRKSGWGPASAEGHGMMTGLNPGSHWQPAPQGASGLQPIPFLHHEPSSSGSIASTGPAAIGQRSIEGPLAIHALLSDQNTTTHHRYEKSSSSAMRAASLAGPRKQLFEYTQGVHSIYGCQSPPFALQNMKVEESEHFDVLLPPADGPSTSTRQGVGRDGFDGMKALLQAGEIVGRHHHS